mmetsp:Transcript_27047/g.23887  ORF Transcript_27047/g.23887 Transcript_27047/m.23887 type:complete len:86 (-) Transcript_27047:30-287(-)
MFEKQRASGATEESTVEISQQLQEEFDEKNRSKPEKAFNDKIQTLLKFANEQIKKQAQEIKSLKGKIPQEEEVEAEGEAVGEKEE